MSYLAKKMVAGGGKSTTAEATRHLSGLTRKTGAGAEAGAARLGDPMGSMRRGAGADKSAKVEAPPVAELDDILAQVLSPAGASSAKPGSAPTRLGWARSWAEPLVVCTAAEGVRSRRRWGLGRRDRGRSGQRLLVRER
jgi:hypothetical protein